MTKLLAIAIVLTLLGGCAGRESDDIVKLRLTQEFAKDERTFHECADWARESLGEDASAAEQMELTNSCLHMQTDLQDREADIKEKEEELESAKRELQEARRKIEDARRKREAERERELEETQRELETERREREAERQRELESARQRELEALRQERESEKQEREWETLNDEVVALLEPENRFSALMDTYDGDGGKKAILLAKRALRLAERQKGTNHPDTATSLHNLARVIYHSYHGKISSALPLLHRTLEIREAKLGKNHPDVAETLMLLAAMYNGQGDASLAEPLFRRALAIREAAFEKDNIKVAQSLHALASVSRNRSSALSLYHRALAIYEATFGKNDHTRVVWVVYRLAELYSEQGDYASAFPFYRRALAMYEAKHGKDHYHVVLPLNYLAVAYMDNGDYASAELLLNRALAIYDKRGYFNKRTVRNMARLFRGQGKYSQGASFLHRVLKVHKERNPYSWGKYRQQEQDEFRGMLKKICDAWAPKGALALLDKREKCTHFFTPEEKP